MYYFVFVYLIVLSVSAETNPHINNKANISMVSFKNYERSTSWFVHAVSPVWDANTQRVYFADPLAQNLHWYDVNTGILSTHHIGYGQVNMISLVEDSDRLLVSARAALYLLDLNVPGDKALRLLTSLDLGFPDNVVSVGKPDVLGRLWTGTKGQQSGDSVTPDKASLYRISQEDFVHPTVKLRPVSELNGIAWSPNNTVFYFTDSSTKKIEAFDFNLETGDISGRRTIMNIEDHGFKGAIPSGMTIDTDGNLWVAIMFGGEVIKVNPDNRSLLNRIVLSTPQVTSLCWCGPQLSILIVTTSSVVENGAGALFFISPGSYGVPPHTFRFNNANKYWLMCDTNYS